MKPFRLQPNTTLKTNSHWSLLAFKQSILRFLVGRIYVKKAFHLFSIIYLIEIIVKVKINKYDLVK